MVRCSSFNLDPLPPKAVAKKYIELAGGENNALKMRGMPMLKLTIDGLPRFLKHIVLNNPQNQQAKRLIGKYVSSIGLCC